MHINNYAVRRNTCLISYNSFGLNSIADTVCYPFNENGVVEIFKNNPSSQIVILGNGTNVLLTKPYYDKDYVFISMKLLDSIQLENDCIVAEAGIPLNRLVWFSVERGIEGFEFLEDIPGSVGGAVVMNAGTYSDNIAQLLEEIVYYDINDGSIHTVIKDELDFRTRGSQLSNGSKIVLRVRFIKKTRNDLNYLSSIKKLFEIKENRYIKQPRNYPSAGSIFKRPIRNGKQEEVWRLVNDVGLRGYRVGGAEISEKHTGFIVNLGNAKYEDIEELIQLTKKKVLEKFSIELEEEVKRI